LGNVGIGFTREDKWLLKEHFEKYGPFCVEICCQGLTEGAERKAWHAGYRRVVG
jgi:hypothetical protein